MLHALYNTVFVLLLVFYFHSCFFFIFSVFKSHILFFPFISYVFNFLPEFMSWSTRFIIPLLLCVFFSFLLLFFLPFQIPQLFFFIYIPHVFFFSFVCLRELRNFLNLFFIHFRRFFFSWIKELLSTFYNTVFFYLHSSCFLFFSPIQIPQLIFPFILECFFFFF